MRTLTQGQVNYSWELELRLVKAVEKVMQKFLNTFAKSVAKSVPNFVSFPTRLSSRDYTVWNPRILANCPKNKQESVHGSHSFVVMNRSLKDKTSLLLLKSITLVSKVEKMADWPHVFQ